jgi:hypothetical protein
MAGAGAAANEKNDDCGVGFVAGLAAEIASLHLSVMDEILLGGDPPNLDGCHERSS